MTTDSYDVSGDEAVRFAYRDRDGVLGVEDVIPSRLPYTDRYESAGGKKLWVLEAWDDKEDDTVGYDLLRVESWQSPDTTLPALCAEVLKRRAAVAAVEKFLAAGGHDLCWENRAELARAFGLEDPRPKTVTRKEFERGCVDYQDRLYGEKETTMTTTTKGFRLTFTSKWVKEHCLARADYHETKRNLKNKDAADLRAKLDQMSPSNPQAESISYANKMGASYSAPDPRDQLLGLVTSVEVEAKNHHNKSLAFKLFAEHLFETDYDLDENDLKRLEILR